MPISSISTARSCAAAIASILNPSPSSIKRVTGFEVTLAGVAIHGNTDTGILREACSQAGIPADVLEPQIAAILEAMCDQRGRTAPRNGTRC